MEEEYVLSVKEISKNFGVVQALTDVSVNFKRGEVHGLIGENGSGKSTLASIITGVYRADQGIMKLNGETYQPSSLIDAGKKGIAMIVQEMGSISGITAAANIFPGKENMFSRMGIVNKRKMEQEARKILDRIGASHIHAETVVDEYSFENRKIIEIARAVQEELQILIVDETTTALSQQGRDILYQLIKQLKKDDKTIIFISHDLDELTKYCDTVTVLRDGRYVCDLHKEEISPDKMRQLMVGRDMQDDYYRIDYKKPPKTKAVLSVDSLTGKRLKNICLDLRKGEILGIGGLTDCGMHELGRMIFGIDRPDSGKVYTGESRTEITNPRMAIRHKIGYVSKNRDQESIMRLSNIRDNICLPSYDKLKKKFYISRKAENDLAERESQRLQVKMSSLDQLCIQLSGGNKQKVALAKWLGNESDILILDCPTRGIDVGVKAAIYQLMEQYIKDGKSIIMISEELPELIGMSDRIIILKEGIISGEFKRDPKLSESDIIKYMI